MALHSTSPNFKEEPQVEKVLPGEKRAARADGLSPRAIEDGAVGPRDLGSPGPDLGSQENVVAANVALDWVLQEIVQQARLATSATGGFISLERAGKVSCQATSGSTAGEFAAYLNRDRRLVDACLRAGALVRCRDSETSDVLDGSACRYLGARTVVMVPILDESERKLGVFGVFSPQADAFSNSSIVVLQSLTRRIADAVAQVDRCTGVASGEASAPLRSNKVRPDNPGRSWSTRARILRALQRPLAFRGTAVLVVGILAVVLAVGWTLSRAGNQQAVPTLEKASTGVRVAAGSSLAAAAQSSSGQSSSGQSLSSQSLSEQPLSNRPSSGPALSGQAGSGQAGSEQAGATPGQSPTVAASVTQKLAVTSVVEPSVVKPPVVKPSLVKPSLVKPPVVKPGMGAPAVPKAVKQVPAGPEIHVPDLEVENALDNAASGSVVSEPVEPATASAEPRSEAAPPRPAEAEQKAASTNGGSAPAPPVMLPEALALAYIVEQAPPEYPAEVKDRVRGTLTMDVIVGVDGHVEKLSLLHGDESLWAPVEKAVRNWRFRPQVRDGHPIRFESHIDLHLVLP